MFTGIVEEIGSVQGVTRGARSAIVRIAAKKVLEETRVGDSIAVNGICLTVIKIMEASFSADVMHETLLRSSLGTLRTGSKVNLERAMPANGRFGGHMVSGHIDGTGSVRSIRKEDNAIWYTVRPQTQHLRYIIEKGSVAIDGISLTVATLTKEEFSVSVIPHTAAHTTLSERRIGDIVNVETDCVGKYIEKLLGGSAESGGMTMEKLRSAGY